MKHFLMVLVIAHVPSSLFSNDSILGKRAAKSALFEENRKYQKYSKNGKVVDARLKAHKNCFTGKVLTCVMCKENAPSFSEPRAILEHNREMHPTIKRWNCLACGTTSDHKNYLKHWVLSTDIKDVLTRFEKFDDKKFPYKFNNGKTLHMMRQEARNEAKMCNETKQSVSVSPISDTQKFTELKKKISIFSKSNT